MHDFIQGHQDVTLDVLAMLGEVSSPAIASCLPETTRLTAATAKELLEEIAEPGAVKMKFGTVPRPPGKATLRLRGAFGMIPIFAELVVFSPFLRVAEDLVGFVDLLEFLLGGGFVPGDIGMVFAGEFAEGFLDLR